MGVVALGLTGSLGTGCQVAPAATLEHGSADFDNYCSQCHGETASGKESIGAPSIAGLPAWYITEELHKFRNGGRGAHFDDMEGHRMRPMALTLDTETDVQAVAMYVSSLKPAPPAPSVVGGDAGKGKTLFVTCTACHQADGVGSEAVGAPPLLVQPDWYLVRQLGKFKAGIRGANPKDAKGATMRPMAATLTDDQAVKDVVAYIQTLKH